MDTDSMAVSSENYFKLKDKGLVMEKGNAKLGYLCNDLKGDGLIFYAKYLAPKTYIQEYITKDGIIHTKDTAKMKAKGIPSEYITPDMYEREYGEATFNTLQKKHLRLTDKDVENGISNFTIVGNTIHRTFNRTPYEGMRLSADGTYYPHGYLSHL
jgi:hypothetical protein